MTGIGILNLGCTCYSAAIFQCLAHALPQSEPLEQQQQQQQQSYYSEQAPVTREFASLVQQIIIRATTTTTTTKMRMQALDPQALMTEVCRVSSNGVSWINMQHDAHEFLIELMSLLEAEALRSNKKRQIRIAVAPASVPNNDNDNMTTRRRVLRDMRQHWLLSRAARIGEATTNTIPTESLYGQHIEVKRCAHCDHVSYNFDIFMAIPIFQSSMSAEIRAQRRRTERIADFKCDKCSRVGSTRKEHKVSMAPRVLVGHVMRFTSGTDNKDQRPIELDVRVDLTPLMMPLMMPNNNSNNSKNSCGDGGDEEEGGHHEYRLVAIACHRGSRQHSGHYYAVCEDVTRPGGWVLFDDETTTLVNHLDREVRQQDPYILFYRRCLHHHNHNNNDNNNNN
jgi:ubiquitin C-terminal hydrolase